MQFLLQRTGLVSSYGKEERFIHETLREYSAASALARRYNPYESDAWNYLRRWPDKEWREVVLFLLGIWSEDVLDEGRRDVSEILQTISEDGEAGLLFAGAALAEGVQAQVAVNDDIVDRLLASARVEAHEQPGDRPSVDVSFPIKQVPEIDILAALQGNERVVTGLRALGIDSSVPLAARIRTADALLAHGRPSDTVEILRSIADYQDPMIPFEGRGVAIVLGKLYRKGKSQVRWLDQQDLRRRVAMWARDSSIHPAIRITIAAALKSRGHSPRPEELVSDLEELISDLESGSDIRIPFLRKQGDWERSLLFRQLRGRPIERTSA